MAINRTRGSGSGLVSSSLFLRSAAASFARCARTEVPGLPIGSARRLRPLHVSGRLRQVPITDMSARGRVWRAHALVRWCADWPLP